MQRFSIEPRPDWQKIVESQGMYYHTIDGRPYWDESAYYHFEAREADQLEECTYWLNQYALQAVDYIIEKDLLAKLGIPTQFQDWIKKSWDQDEHTIYGRFDLCYNGDAEPKLFEYNADTPTALLEAAVIQWHWFKEKFPDEDTYDQFNSIHEQLIAAWKSAYNGSWPWYFAALADNLEDYMTVNYLRDTAIQAGLLTEYIHIEQIGWHPTRQCWTDLNERKIENCFKLYPWEWMFKEQFGEHLLKDMCNWLEPPWKALMSNKGFMVIMSELFPDSPYILKATWEPFGDSYIRKPLHGREGANMQIVKNGKLICETNGPYDGPFVYQELKELPVFDGFHPVVGSWVVNGWSCGIGIREDSNLITGNASHFVPHIFSK